MNVNRNHRNSVFSMLFSTSDVLRELYSAIEGVDVPYDAVVSINTLSDVFFMEKINDLSFTIDNRIVVLIEHQSTINDNMPVRFLMYIGRVYEKITENKKRYQRKLLKIPKPEFIVLYNGKEPYPDYNELKLSLAYKDTEGLKKQDDETLPLELVVKVYNINHGKNPEMMKRSVTLNGYSLFLEKVKEYSREKPLEESLEDAIKYCIENDILKSFLTENSSEVINMLMGEWNWDDAKEVWQEEAREEGREEGRCEGRCEGIEEEKLIITRNLLAEGSTHEFIHKITGLDLEIIKSL